MVHDTDASDDFSNALDLVFVTGFDHITGMTDEHLALGNFISTLDSTNLSVFIEKNLVNILVEHESTSVNGAHSRETFRDTSESIDRVDERRLTVSAMRIHIELNSLDGFNHRSVNEAIISVKGNSVTNEVDSVGTKIELLDQGREGLLVGIIT
mgnify:CR=1 FL=1